VVCFNRGDEGEDTEEECSEPECDDLVVVNETKLNRGSW
jgi:hypothetical protein